MKLLYFIYKEIEYEIRIGQNKHENWELLDDADKDDIWFHAANTPSAYVILSAHTPPKPVIEYCAELCQAHSKTKKDDVIYTPIRNVSKGKHVGEAIVTNSRIVRK